MELNEKLQEIKKHFDEISDNQLIENLIKAGHGTIKTLEELENEF